MSSVAAAATIAAPAAMSTESDLVRRAAKGEAESFGELYRRHSAPAWRLAQAVGPDRDSAVLAFGDGFVTALRSSRPGRRAGEEFRPVVLSSVYRATLGRSYDRTATPAASRRAQAAGPDAVLADAAFRSLPERWRAAVWLHEVENFDRDHIATVLSVSPGVADQLIARGGRGLAGRFAQVQRPVPDHLGEVLRPLAMGAPANLEQVTAARWSAGGAENATMLAPLGTWLEDRAVRPMGVAVGTLVGLGPIALGVVPGGTTVRAGLGSDTTSNLPGAVPVGNGSNTPVGASNRAADANGFLSYTFPSGGSGGTGGSGTYLTGGYTGGSGGLTGWPGSTASTGGTASTGETGGTGGTAGIGSVGGSPGGTGGTSGATAPSGGSGGGTGGTGGTGGL